MPRKHSSTSHPSGMTVLCVDDQVEFLESLRPLLEREGHRVLTACGGEAGLAVLAAERVDLLLLDYMMPDLDAEAVLARVRDPGLQVVLLTGYADERPPREMLERLNIQGYCDKSRGVEEILLWTDVGLRGSRTSRQLEATRREMAQILASLHPSAPPTPGPRDMQAVAALCAALPGIERVRLAVRPLPDPFPGPSSFEEVPPGPEREEEVVEAEIGWSGGLGERLSRAFPDPSWLRHCRETPPDGAVLPDGTGVLPFHEGGLCEGRLIVQPAPSTLGEIWDHLIGYAQLAALKVAARRIPALDPDSGNPLQDFWSAVARRELRRALQFRLPLGHLRIEIEAQVESQRPDLLRKAGTVLRATLRSSDLGALGHDGALLVLLPQTDEEGVVRLAGLLEERLAEAWRSQGLPGLCLSGISWLDPAACGPVLRPLSATYFEEMEALLRARAAESIAEARLHADRSWARHPRTDWLPARRQLPVQ